MSLKSSEFMIYPEKYFDINKPISQLLDFLSDFFDVDLHLKCIFNFLIKLLDRVKIS